MHLMENRAKAIVRLLHLLKNKGKVMRRILKMCILVSHFRGEL